MRAPLKFAVITAENLASNNIIVGLLDHIANNIAFVCIVPNLPFQSARHRERVWRLTAEAAWQFKLFKAMEVFGSSALHFLRGTLIRHRCRARGIKVLRCADASAPEFKALLKSEGIDILLSAGPAILPRAVIYTPPLGTLNCHCARLPNFAGPANYVWMALEGVEELYVSLQLMEPELDSGPVLHEALIRHSREWSVYAMNWHLSRFAGQVYGQFCRCIIAAGLVPNKAPAVDPAYAEIRTRGLPGRASFRALRRKGISLIRIMDPFRYY
jgi:hypothetical protein